MTTGAARAAWRASASAAATPSAPVAGFDTPTTSGSAPSARRSRVERSRSRPVPTTGTSPRLRSSRRSNTAPPARGRPPPRTARAAATRSASGRDAGSCGSTTTASRGDARSQPRRRARTSAPSIRPPAGPEEVLRQVALGEPVDQLDLLPADGRLGGHRPEQVELARVEREGRAGARRRGPGPRRRRPATARPRRPARYRGRRRPAARSPDSGEVRRRRAGGGRRGAPHEALAAVDRVDDDLVGVEQVARRLGDCGQQLGQRGGAGGTVGDLGQPLELVHAPPRRLVQPRVLDRPGHQRGGVDHERGVVLRQRPRRQRVEADHAEQRAVLRDQGHRHHRLVLLLLELGEVPGARVGQRVGRDEDRLAVLGRPTLRSPRRAPAWSPRRHRRTAPTRPAARAGRRGRRSTTKHDCAFTPSTISLTTASSTCSRSTVEETVRMIS